MSRMGFLAGVRRGGLHTIGRSALVRRAIASDLSVLSVAEGSVDVGQVTSVFPRKVLEIADRRGADRTWDRAEAAQE